MRCALRCSALPFNERADDSWDSGADSTAGGCQGPTLVPDWSVMNSDVPGRTATDKSCSLINRIVYLDVPTVTARPASCSSVDILMNIAVPWNGDDPFEK